MGFDASALSLLPSGRKVFCDWFSLIPIFYYNKANAIQEDIDLKKYSTMRLGGRERWLAEANSDNDVQDLILWAHDKNAPILMIGEGSNIIWRDEGFNGLVIVNHILGRKVLNEDVNGATIQVGAGEVWDDIVGWAVEKGLSGIEFLSLIPGSAGRLPFRTLVHTAKKFPAS